MRLQAALVAATSVASTSAFLITPEIADTVKGAKNNLINAVLGASQSVDVKCHECPAFLGETENGDAYVAMNGVETTIHLDFSTKTGNLQINNETVFPLEAVNDKFPKLMAHQTRLDTNEELAPVPIDFTLFTQPIAKPRRHPNRFGFIQEDDHELISIDFTVIGLARQPIKAQTAHADLIHHDGIYTLARLRTAAFQPTSPEENDLEVCQSSRNVQLCRVRLLANRKLREMMQGALDRANAIKQWMKTHGPGNKARPCNNFNPGQIGTMKGGHRYQHGGKEYGHGYHHRHHRIVRVLFFLVKALVVPAVLGFAVGFTISAVGMLVGQFIVFLWTRLYRGHRGPVRDRSEVALEDGEKEGLMADDEELPAYVYLDEVPAYEDVDVKRDSQE